MPSCWLDLILKLGESEISDTDGFESLMAQPYTKMDTKVGLCAVIFVGFRIIARVSEALPGRAIFFPGLFGISRDSSVYFVIFRDSSGFFGKGSARGGNPGPRQGTARHLKAPPGRAVRFSVNE